MEKRKIILALAGAALGVCICSAIDQMDQVKGPAVELADFTDIPYQEGLNRMSEDCVYDLDFDGLDVDELDDTDDLVLPDDFNLDLDDDNQ